ncbi:MAG: nodulation protein NfeD [Alphaproteobacteria bacterium]|jgi:membrane-bound serine protease (ClpP class)|nr:nodulation protein NfeD [Alphaproteobacteria bacterium]
MKRGAPHGLPALLLAGCALLAALATGAARAGGEALLIPVEGAIGAATGELVVSGLDQAAEDGAEVVILRLDTPGGLDKAMRRIIKAILASPVPVVAYVAPSGARAASAGTYILYASQIAAMAPATNLGAATPVQVGGLPGIGEPAQPGDGEDSDEAGGDSGSAMERKLVEDAVAYIRGLAELRGRNADWAEAAVRESVSLTANAAAERDVVDLVAADVAELLAAIDGRSVRLPDGARTLETDALTVREIEPGWRARLLAVIANPNVAYLLMLIGIYGIIFELSNPGALFPGVLGAISLLLALYALQVLPVSYAGVALILLGIGLMVAEALVPSFGALGLGGLAAFVFGSVILMDEDGVAVSLPVIGVTGALAGGMSFWVIGRLLGLRRRTAVIGAQHLVGRLGEAREAFGGTDPDAGGGAAPGLVHLEGENWQADSRAPVRPGQRVRVLRVDGLRLLVEPAEDGGRPAHRERTE